MKHLETNHATCSRCVMDTSDPEITFDSRGVCNHCTKFDAESKDRWFPNEEGKRIWNRTVERIKALGHRNEYDCILGLSGGADSSYLALKVYEKGLRPLVVHVDAGWNTELAVANIEAITRHCAFDLHTHVVNWEEMRDLQLAYLRAGVSNQDVPQDHIFFSSLYHFATKNRIRYVLSGGNFSTECVFPQAWQGSAMDAISLKAIHKRFGERRLRDYRTISFSQYYIWYPFVKRMRVISPLNYMPYHKRLAVDELRSAIGWRDYGRKHGESLFTKVFQNDYLPRKFGYDKRRPHLSSLVLSGQLSREDALLQLKEPLYDDNQREIDLTFFCKKLRISRDQYEDFISSSNGRYEDYPNWKRRQQALKLIQSTTGKLIGRRINVYS